MIYLEITPELITFNIFYSAEHPKLEINEDFFISEVAGKDSIAAIIQTAKNYNIKNLLGIGIFHRSFFGNINDFSS